MRVGHRRLALPFNAEGSFGDKLFLAPYEGFQHRLLLNEKSMDCLPSDCKTILLVGEANFSFSVSLIKHISGDIQITASSFEAEEDVSGRLQGGDNVKALKQHGAEVFYEVDATRLHKTLGLQDRVFDVIIFNFPHTGRKGSIKKNRQLLKEFFTSCASQLTPSGRVLLSLCNGQGGTPMDCPQREWHNSWQVVAMATFGGFILTAAIPFESLLGEGYCNTGYRGQNKGFHKEGAVTHIFEKGLPLTLPSTKLMPLTITTNVHGTGRFTFQPPLELAHFFSRKLLQQIYHPLRIAKNGFLSTLKDSIPNLQEFASEILPEIIQPSGTRCPAVCVAERLSSSECNLERGVLPDVKCLEESQSNKKGDLMRGVLVKAEDQSVKKEAVDDGSQDTHSDPMNDVINTYEMYTFPSSLLQHGPFMLATYPSQPSSVASEVYHKCPIARDLPVLPIMHQLLIFLPEQCQTSLWNDFEQILLNAIKLVLNSKWNVEVEPIASDEKDTQCYRTLGAASISLHALCSLPDSVQVNTISTVTLTNSQCSNHVGLFGEVTSNLLAAKFALLSLDYLVMHSLNISDIRMLWSEDSRQWEPFQQSLELMFQKHVTSPYRISFEPLCKFSPVYTHDLSFWVSKDVKFDELKFYSIVYSITGRLLEDLKLVDFYQDKSTGQCSHCYRLVYKSIDRALSKDQAAQIQLLVREHVNKEMPVILR